MRRQRDLQTNGPATLSGGNLILQGTNGTAGSTFYRLTSASVTAPRSSWTRESTNLFAAGGGFSLTNPVSLAVPGKFCILQVP